MDVNQLPGMEAAEEIDEYPYWQPACDDQREAEQEAVAFWAKYIDARKLHFGRWRRFAPIWHTVRAAGNTLPLRFSQKTDLSCRRIRPG